MDIDDDEEDAESLVESKEDHHKKHKKRRSRRRFNAHLKHVPSDESDLLIETINGMDIGWKADTCKLQKHHSQYSEADCDTLMLAQIDNSEKSQAFGTQKDFEGTFEKARKY